MIEFDWVITLGQLISTVVIIVAIVAIYGNLVTKYAAARSRITGLESQVKILQEELLQLRALIQRSEKG